MQVNVSYNLSPFSPKRKTEINETGASWKFLKVSSFKEAASVSHSCSRTLRGRYPPSSLFSVKARRCLNPRPPPPPCTRTTSKGQGGRPCDWRVFLCHLLEQGLELPGLLEPEGGCEYVKQSRCKTVARPPGEVVGSINAAPAPQLQPMAAKQKRGPDWLGRLPISHSSFQLLPD